MKFLVSLIETKNVFNVIIKIHALVNLSFPLRDFHKKLKHYLRG